MKFKLLKSTNKQFYFVIIARNGKVIATSETYKRRDSMMKAMNIIDPEMKCEKIDQTQ